MVIEQIIFDFMNGTGSGMTVPTYTETPENPPASYTTIERTGERMENRHSAYTFAFKSYAPTLLETIKLNDAVKDAILLLPSVDGIMGVRIQSTYNSTDTRTKQHRYTAIAVIYA